jgi:hypothetical protein
MHIRQRAQKLIVAGGLLLAMGLMTGSLFAQQIEIHPYAGGFFPRKWADTDLKKEGLYGVRGGVYLMDFVQLDVNYAYINHFRFKNTPDFGTRAWLWDFNASYSLNNYNVRQVEPFLTIGVGGLTTGVHGAGNNSGLASSTVLSTLPLKDNDSFFQFTYGGGVKAVRLWGPVGLRADVRGRTLPNFYGSSLTWLETTGGINIMWGER